MSMSRRMKECPKCLNRVRTLYEWKGINYCGMCQQVNIERHEATLIYRFFFLWMLVRDFVALTFTRVVFPQQGYIRRFTRVIVYECSAGADLVKSKVRRWRVS